MLKILKTLTVCIINENINEVNNNSDVKII